MGRKLLIGYANIKYHKFPPAWQLPSFNEYEIRQYGVRSVYHQSKIVGTK